MNYDTQSSENSIPLCPTGRYQHYKGLFYQVLHFARHSETCEWLVVYQCLYDDFSIWVRPIKMFMEMIDHEGQIQPRFKWIE